MQWWWVMAVKVLVESSERESLAPQWRRWEVAGDGRWEMAGDGRRWETGESRRCEAARWFQVTDVVVRS